MRKQILIASLCLLSTCAPACAAASLTARETRWLTAAAPVLAYSHGLKLPIARPGCRLHDGAKAC